MSVRIATDSAADLPFNVIRDYNVIVYPLLVYLDGEEYLDSVNLLPDALYDRMREGAQVKTAQIPMAYFIETFEHYAKNGDDVIYLAFSSGLSGTYQTAVMAYQTVQEMYPSFHMTIVDTKCVSLGLGLIVLEASQMASQGATRDAILQYVSKAINHQRHVFSVDDLEYLFRGGRVSRAQATVGNLLNIKPILKVENGLLKPFEKVKGRKKRLQKLMEYAAEHGVALGDQTIGIAHAANEEEALALKSHFEETYGTKQFVIGQLGCAVGAHCGPGLITLFFKDALLSDASHK